MKLLPYFLLIVVCSACTINTSSKLKELSAKSILLEGKPMQQDSILWGSYIIGFSNNHLIIACYTCNPPFNMYTIDNNSIYKEGEFIKKGDGPYEFIYSPTIYLDPVTRELFLFGINSTSIKAYKIDVSVMPDVFDYKYWTKIQWPEKEKHFWRNFVPINDSIFLGLGGDDDKTNLLSVIYPYKNEIKELNIEYPDDRNPVKKIIKRGVYNNGELSKRRSDNQYLYTCLMGNYAEIITLDSQANVSGRKVIVDDFPIYKAAPDGLNPLYENESLTGLYSYVTDQKIYLMQTPYNKEEYFKSTDYKGYPKYYSDALYIFDWEGRFIKAYTLDKPICSFAVDEKDSFLIGITMNLKDGEFYMEKYFLN